MFDFLLNDVNFAFTVALTIVFGLALLEGVALVIGSSVMTLLDDLTGFDVDADMDADVSSGGLSSLLGWLCLDRLPLLVWLILILTSFGLSGLIYNYVVLSSFNVEILYWLAKPTALFCALIITHTCGDIIAKIVPKNESSAVSVSGFSGKVATITVGKARKGSAAQASLVDEFNQKHYVMVEPGDEQQEFLQGTKVVLLEKVESGWIAAPFNP
ncbi:OB-fold-containig protein [Thalassotalea litorea]|uniref:OB-fold-containig protein n=1 Tax=Thalassotalea litorea TaxID=2020715 RepID=UPI001485A473|nr:OB-fold-containig protein [Thalassotalea litorea]